ncbi:hypothetical protein Pan258_01800 [Symmachiella dynata]|uniref:hypothetical protein n=1 Tax=Symmachiella dynata TaxID=2527995 RepID=UPI001188B5C3|nr:hypothetical protein [Symmachiella dynata]QDT46163.1 hypothetical protein Pan258_01800 [Symmachiella dynata]
MLEAFRNIEIPVQLKDRTETIQIPFTVELLHRVEETIERSKGASWLRLFKNEKSLVEAFDWFAGEYLPADLDLSKVHPTFTALFFSSVRSELISSFNTYEKLMNSMGESTEPIAENEATQEHPSE